MASRHSGVRTAEKAPRRAGSRIQRPTERAGNDRVATGAGGGEDEGCGPTTSIVAEVAATKPSERSVDHRCSASTRPSILSSVHRGAAIRSQLTNASKVAWRRAAPEGYAHGQRKLVRCRHAAPPSPRRPLRSA